MDKIYSRKRIRIPMIKKPKPKKRNPIKLCLNLIFLLFVVSIVSFVFASYPIFVASCKTAAGSKATHIIQEEVENRMNYYTYSDFIKIEKNEAGQVTLMQANTVLLNQIISKITNDIQTRIDQSPTTMVYINYGSVSGISILKNFGPKFEIELETAGAITTQVKSQFESVGINQTLHKIYLELNGSIGILTPIGSFSKEVASQVLLTEAIIVGEIPDTFYNFNGMKQDDVLNVLE